MKTIKIAVIQWLDARKHTEATEIDQITGGLLLISAGVLVKDETDFMAIANDAGNDGYYRDVTVIPREYIKQVKIVRVSLTPKKPVETTTP